MFPRSWTHMYILTFPRSSKHMYIRMFPRSWKHMYTCMFPRKHVYVIGRLEADFYEGDLGRHPARGKTYFKVCPSSAWVSKALSGLEAAVPSRSFLLLASGSFRNDEQACTGLTVSASCFHGVTVGSTKRFPVSLFPEASEINRINSCICSI